MKIGQRVRLPNHEFLSDGEIKHVVMSPGFKTPFAYNIKLDRKAPNEYALEDNEVLMLHADVEAI